MGSMLLWREALLRNRTIPLRKSPSGRQAPLVRFKEGGAVMQVAKLPTKPIIRYPFEDPETGWNLDSKRTGIVAQKVGMTLDWDRWGKLYPLTILKVVNCYVSQTKTKEHDGVDAVQVCAGTMPLKRLTRSKMGIFAAADVPPARYITEFKVTQDALVPKGTRLNARHFIAGQKIDVQGITKGKGFQGAMKRWGFKGGSASHGNSLAHRTIGATGARQDPGKVWKGKKMPGKMGAKKTTIRALKVFYIRPKEEIFAVVGAVPGPAGGFIRCTDSRSNDFLQPPPFPTHFPRKGEEIPEILIGDLGNPFFWMKELGEDAVQKRDAMWDDILSNKESTPEEKAKERAEVEKFNKTLGSKYLEKVKPRPVEKKKKLAKRSKAPFISRIYKTKA